MSRRPRPGPLRANLWRVGVRSASLRGVNALGAVLASLAFVALWLGLASGVVASTFYAHRAAVSSARAPLLAEVTGVPPAVRWLELFTGVEDRTSEVIALEPITIGAPLPPGVERWPEPGEAVLSPALRDLLQERGVPDRYGTPAGVIGRAGLASQTELLAYVRLPGPLEADWAWPLAGFGAPPGEAPYPIGEVSYDRSVAEFWSMALLLVVLPGVVALAAAARVADEQTRRRHVLLARLGAGWGARAFVALPRALLPAVVSLVAALGLLLAAVLTDLTVPFKGNVLDAAVTREALPALLAVVLGVHAAGVVALALLTASRQRDLGASRLVAPPDRPAWVRTWVFLAVLAAQPWVLALAPDPSARVLATLAAAVVTVVCLPAALATGLRSASAWQARRALASGRAGAFLGWRATGYRSRALARLTAVVGALVVVVGHAAVVLAMFTGPALQARLAASEVGSSLLAATPYEGQDPALASPLVVFAEGRGLASVEVDVVEIVNEDGMTLERELRLVAACADLQVLGAACRDGPLVRERDDRRLDVLQAWYGRSSPVRVHVAAPGTGAGPDGSVTAGEGHPFEQRHLVVLSRDGSDLDGMALGRDAYRQGLVADFDLLGASALRGAVDLLHKSYWLFVFGVPGVVALLVVGGLTWAAVVVEESQALVRSPLLAERRDVFSSVAAVRVGLPVAAGGVAGAAATAWLLVPHVRTGAAQMPTAFLVGATAATLAAAVLAWWITRNLAASSSRKRWSEAGDTRSTV